jgi:hypothetical protein
MALPSRLVVHDFAYALDGGTISLRADDEDGRERRILLVQHAFPQAGASSDEIPGRLYFDGELVPTRSPLEAAVLNLLKTAAISSSGAAGEQGAPIQLSPNALILGEDIRQVLTRGPEENLRAFVAEVVHFVESEAYLLFAEQVAQAADPVRYTVWAAWDESTRRQVLVKLGRVLGIGLRASRELLERGTPLAGDLTAPEVSRLARRYASEGLAVRVEPPFPWKLGLASD